MVRTSSAPHWSDSFDPRDVVDGGKGYWLEQLIPEQGLCRPGAGRSSGFRALKDELSATINSSKRFRFNTRSDREATRWLQPAQEELGAQTVSSTRSMMIPVPACAIRLRRTDRIAP
jgi:hypothetical protein